MSRPRTAFFIPADQFDENGFIPSLVTEGEPGHAPMRGNGPLASPWYWGKTYEDAKRVCDQQNAEMGLTTDDVAVIIGSSIGAGNVS